MPWWRLSILAIACPHGFCGPNASPPQRCLLPSCVSAFHTHLRAARLSLIDLPRRDDPVRWPREYRAPSAFDDPCPPVFSVVAAHEHTGAFRNAWSAVAVPAASVALRPSVTPPAPNAAHYIADVQQWFDWYPLPIVFASFQPDCGPAVVAAPNSAANRWARHLASGSLATTVRHAVWCMHAAPIFALEQPPTLLEHIIGPPTVRTSLAEFGIPRRKMWWWWQSPSLPVASPNFSVPEELVVNFHHSRDDLEHDRRSISRAPTPPMFAEQHVRAWLPLVRDAAAQPLPPAPSTLDAATTHALARLLLVSAARVATRVPSELPPYSIVLVPSFRFGADLHALLPCHALFGLELSPDADPEPPARHIAAVLTCAAPMLAHVHSTDSSRHFIYVAPPLTSPPAPAAFEDVAWVTETSLADSPTRLLVAIALRRFRHVFEPVAGVDAVIGVSGPPVPLTRNPEASRWRDASPTPSALYEWRAFLDDDAAAAARFAEELRRLDRGDGKLAQWAAAVQCVRDFAHEVDTPPQGLPRVAPELLWAILPDIYVPDPLPVASHMLVRLPPQSLPPGPMPAHATEALQPWAVRRLFDTAAKLCARETWFFSHPINPRASADDIAAWIAAAPPAPEWLLLGDGAFRLIPHADGLSSWRANMVLFDVLPDGTLRVFDTAQQRYLHWVLNVFRETFDPRDDLELLSFIFDGFRYKASPPRQLRIGPNMDSLATHIRPIADDISKLSDAGLYRVRPLYWLSGPLRSAQFPRHIWPIAFLPTWTSPVGAVDKKDKAFEKRRISNGSAPYGRPRAKESPHGDAAGPECLSFNELCGPMRPPNGVTLPPDPPALTPWGSPCDGCSRATVSFSTQGRHAWWGRLYCVACWSAGTAISFEPFKWNRERKHTPAHVYQALAFLRAAASVGNSHVFTFTIDYRWWFWQFSLSPEEYWCSCMFAVARVGDHHAFCLVGELVANMGRAPVSNAASGVGSHQFNWVRARAFDREDELLAREHPDLRSLVDRRRGSLGSAQSALFWLGCYTDDGLGAAVGEKRAALIARDVHEHNARCNVWLADLPKCPLGTIVDHIGGRYLANAGFGTVAPPKRARALAGLRSAITNSASCDEFESSAGLLGHLVDLLALDRTLLHGTYRHLSYAREHRLPTVRLSAGLLAQYLELEFYISTRACAPFASAVLEASLSPPLAVPPAPLVLASDACTDAAFPAIFVHAHGICVRVPLVDDWTKVHITVTESLGPAVGSLEIAPLFPQARLLAQVDATSALAFLRGTVGSPCLQRIRRRWLREPAAQDFILRASAQHIAGRANTVDDAGSRGYDDILAAYAAACGVRLSFREPGPATAAFLADALHIALQYAPPHDAPLSPVRLPDLAGFPDPSDPFFPEALAIVADSGLAPDALTALECGSPRGLPHSLPVLRGVPVLPLDPHPWVGPSSSSPRLDEAIIFVAASPPPRLTVTFRTVSPVSFPHAASPSHATPSSMVPTRRSLIASLGASPSVVAASPVARRATLHRAGTPPPATTSSPRAGRHSVSLDHTPSTPPPIASAARSPSARQASPTPRLRSLHTPHTRPATADAVRALAAMETADALIDDSSPFAVCPENPQRIRDLVQQVDLMQRAARSTSSHRLDNWGYKWFVRACDSLPCPVLRPRNALFAQRECFIGSWAVMYAAANMRPRDRSRPAADPSSAWAAYCHARTVLAAYGCLLPALADVRQTLRGMLKAFVRQYGDDILVPRRKQPFSRAQEVAIDAVLAAESVPGWSPARHRMARLACRFSRSTAARKKELCQGDAFFARGNVDVIIDGDIVPPSPENLSRATMFRIRSTVSKCDVLNRHWGAHPMYVTVNDAEHFNLGAALRDSELAFPCSPAERATFPIVFDPDRYSGATPPPVATSFLDHMLAQLLAAAMRPDEAAERSWHSWRITLGCSLRAAVDTDHPDGRSLDLIKAFGRWKSDEAVVIYGRLTPAQYAHHVSASLAADAANLSATSSSSVMRGIDPIDMIDDINRAVEDAKTSAGVASSSSGPAHGRPRATAPSSAAPARREAPPPKTTEAPKRRRRMTPAPDPEPAPPPRFVTAPPAPAPPSARFPRRSPAAHTRAARRRP